MQNLLSYLMPYEEGELDDGQVVELFQFLVDSGLAWQLQGHYGRNAAYLIDIGAVTAPRSYWEPQGDEDGS